MLANDVPLASLVKKLKPINQLCMEKDRGWGLHRAADYTKS